MLVLGVQTYDRGAFHPHADLHARVGLQPGHFDRWLALWYATVDELFAGPRAELVKATAYRLAGAFRGRLQAYPSPRDPAPDPAAAGGAAAPGGLLVIQHAGDHPD